MSAKGVILVDVELLLFCNRQQRRCSGLEIGTKQISSLVHQNLLIGLENIRMEQLQQKLQQRLEQHRVTKMMREGIKCYCSCL